MEKLLSITEVATTLQIKPSTLRAWTLRRRIPFVKIGGRSVRFRASDVEKLIRAGVRPALRPLHEAESEEGGAG